MHNLQWTIGNVDVFQIYEVEAGEVIESIFEEATPEEIEKITWLKPNFIDLQGKFKANVQAFLVKSNGKNILIDTCNGNDKKRPEVPAWTNLQTDFIEKLAKLDVTAEQVDVVACTHLHFDHVGWNTKLVDGKWIPTFPNADYLFSRKEYEYWQTGPEKEAEDDHMAFDDSVKPIIEADLAKLVEVNHRIDENISFIPTPGHTPFHVSVLIESEDQRAIISGDFVHHPCQIARPKWSTIVDTYPEQAIKSREDLLAELVDTDTLLIGSHFAEPVAGRVVSHNGTDKHYKLVTAK